MLGIQKKWGSCSVAGKLFKKIYRRKQIALKAKGGELQDLYTVLLMLVIFFCGYSTKITSKQKEVALWIPAAGIMLYNLD